MSPPDAPDLFMQDAIPEPLSADDPIVAGSLAAWLISGGDGRNDLEHSTGLNRYGCSPFLRPHALPFGSCTSSSPTRRALVAAQEALDELRLAYAEGLYEQVADAMVTEIREELRQQLGIQRMDDVEIALTPSGTDAEYVALLAATAGHEGRVCNVLIGPNEAGGGTALAAGGRHFNARCPSGATREVGASIDAPLSGRVDVRIVEFRDDAGSLRDPDAIDADVHDLARAAIARGEVVLIHAIAHSKTGVHAPTPRALASLRAEHGDRVLVVVDAAQGRVSRRGLQEVVGEGAMVLFTGSKFYGGPPFSGAVLIPDAARRRPSAIPPGLGDYMFQMGLPRSWQTLPEVLPRRPNAGLIVRWRAALAEIRGYYAAPARDRFEVMRAFESMVPAIFSGTRSARLLRVPTARLPEGAQRVLESKTTVFPFTVQLPHGRFATMQELSRLHRWMNLDARSVLPDLPSDEARCTAAAQVHLGQPVCLGRDAAQESVLRLALGGPLIAGAALDPHYGATLNDRIAWLRRAVQTAADKLDLLVEHLDRLPA